MGGASSAEEDVASADAEVGPEEGTGTGSEAKPVVGKNTVASEPREVGSHRFLAFSAGALLLAAGILVGRRLFWC